MSGYDLSRLWFSFAFENPDVKPVHTALFFWIVERANASGWKKVIDIQTEKSMESLGITDWRTYKNGLQFLHDNNIIAWLEKSKNQYTCNKVSLLIGEADIGESYKNAYTFFAEPNAEAIAEALVEAYDEAYVEAIAEALQSYINLKTLKPKNPKTEKPTDNWLESFEQFWTVYDKKVGRKKAEQKWKIMTLHQRQSALDNVAGYVHVNNRKQFRKDPVTYLNGECWNDELILPETKQTGLFPNQQPTPTRGNFNQEEMIKNQATKKYL
jgi:hypothetical protein